MNQRDENRGGRGGRFGSARGDEGRYGDEREQEDPRERQPRSWTERLSSRFRDTYNPEPQWLRDDRERPAAGAYERDEWQRGDPGQRHGVGARDPYAERELREMREAARERERQRAERWRDVFRDEPYRGHQHLGPSHDLSTGWEPARWHDDDYFAGRGSYGGFRVGTGMGLASDDYMRPTFGRSYGDASGYGSSGGYDVGAHQRDTGRSFRGLGPQGYQRADERIRDDVYERLTDSAMIDARFIVVDVNEGNVTLSGTVSDRRMRYAAEDLVERVMGVANINNALKVQRKGAPPRDTDDEGRSH